MKIFIGTDHAGFDLKNVLVKYLTELGHEVEDKGAYTFDKSDDYPDFIRPVAEAVSKDPENVRGIVLGGSGQGEAMAANRYKGVRAIVYYGARHAVNYEEGTNHIIKWGREHNNSNVLSLGARFLTETEAKEAVREWLETDFPGEEHHRRRIEKIDEMGRSKSV